MLAHAAGRPPPPARRAAPHRRRAAPRPAAASGDAPARVDKVSTKKEESADAKVAAALARASAAAAAVEHSLDRIPLLPSARPRRPLPPALRAAWRGARGAASAALLLLAAAHGPAPRAAAAAAVAASVARSGLRSRALSPGGAAAALVVGAASLGASLRVGATVLAFFYAGSALTNAGAAAKAAADAEYRPGGQRTAAQVLAAGAGPALAAVAAAALAAGSGDFVLSRAAVAAASTPLPAVAAAGAALGWLACAAGDTFSSELGALSRATPRLITTGRPVRAGTNGGVTLLGLGGALAGGGVAGAAFWAGGAAAAAAAARDAAAAPAVALATAHLLPLAVAAGLAGSLLDSVLGATLQFTGVDTRRDALVASPGPSVMRVAGAPLLSNAAVNFVSSAAVAAGTAWALVRVLGLA